MATDPLAQAAVFSGQAPSLHNSQPWHWVHAGETLDLRLEPRRVLPITDPDARLAVLSCGAALHHARVHLAATGRAIEVNRMPDDDDPDLLAHIVLGAEAPVDHDAARLEKQASRRRTDRRAPPGSPLDRHLVRTIQQAVIGQGAGLAVLLPSQVFALAEAAEAARNVEAEDPGWQVEVAGWVGSHHPEGTGIPSSALPDDPYLLTAPARALRRAGAELITETHHHAAYFTVLYSADDDRFGWLLAGEGLSAGWLTAAVLRVGVLPLSIVTEVARSRDTIRRLLDWDGYPHLVLRLTTGTTGDLPPATPRLRSTDYITYL
ncbi:Acg family FMN-binding oxidoreductase [Paractinoplanes hotanensis]|uniref:Nitroreductase n=1 Tax=Paractinoplanes hotanensis TaxID=2906497 RepID=A0ABT0YEC7_9ACTN|nr:nitroreductase [Actinoplanes hotanensis]MCM4084397.1 nitroreductase [Actinoplanes hotanensis]